MSDDGSQREEASDFDVVLLHGATDDGGGARVLRARPGRLDAGEVRPMSEGQPLAAGGEVVRLERREGTLPLFDVRVECTMPSTSASTSASTTSPSTLAPRAERKALGPGGPPQVATPAYRENWELTFGSRDKTLN